MIEIVSDGGGVLRVDPRLAELAASPESPAPSKAEERAMLLDLLAQIRALYP